MKDVKEVAKDVITTLKDYEFKTFQVGASIPTKWVEMEDTVRAEFKLKGGHSIKSDLTHRVNQTVSNKIKKKVQYNKPDVVAVIDLISDKIIINPRPIFLLGKYLKIKRGASQKQNTCKKCFGIGCPDCDFYGFSKEMSVEQILNKHILSIFDGKKTTFSWVGGEDSKSLVLGNGRPFFVEINSPKKTHINDSKDLKYLSHGINLTELKPTTKKNHDTHSFRTEILVRAKFEKKISKEKLEKISKKITGMEVEQPSTKKQKISKKKIFLFTIKSMRGKNAQIHLICDGGLGIRRFIAGEGVEIYPNLPNILEMEISLDENKPFDILNVEMFSESF